MGRIQRWLITLREEQQKSNCHVPMAAIVIRNNKIVAKSSNIKGYRGSSLHAETAALRKLRYQKKAQKVPVFSSDVFVMMAQWEMPNHVLTALKFLNFKASNM